MKTKLYQWCLFALLIGFAFTLQNCQKIKKIEKIYKNGPDCEVIKKDFLSEENTDKINGTWKAISWYVHGDDLLGIRNFKFTFRSDNSVKIEEKDTWLSEGKWTLFENENVIELIMEEKKSSFLGRYDFENQQLIISGKGIIGAHEYCCIKMIKE